jgi:hypothetical protein
MTSTTKIWLAAGAIALVAFNFVDDVTGLQTPANSPPSLTQMCEQQILTQLHDPNAATFDRSSFRVSEGDAGYTVRVAVRASNGFGALRLVQMNCAISKTATGGWFITVSETQ